MNIQTGCNDLLLGALFFGAANRLPPAGCAALEIPHPTAGLNRRRLDPTQTPGFICQTFGLIKPQEDESANRFTLEHIRLLASIGRGGTFRQLSTWSSWAERKCSAR